MGPSRAQRRLVALAAGLTALVAGLIAVAFFEEGGPVLAGAAALAVAVTALPLAFRGITGFRVEPFLEVRFAEMPPAFRLAEPTNADGVRSSEATDNATYRITFGRGAGDERDALARRLRAQDEVVAVETGGDRCD